MKKTAICALAMALGVSSSAFAAEIIKDKLEINGEVRVNYLTGRAAVNEGISFDSALRSRVEMVYKPFENLKFVVMAENKHSLKEKRGIRHHDVALKKAYAVGKIDNVDITVGRVGISVADGYVLDDDLERMDSVILGSNIGKKFRVEAYAAQNLDGHELQYEDTKSRLLGARFAYAPTEKSKLKAEYAALSNLCCGDEDGNDCKTKINVLALTASSEVAKDLTASAMYFRGKPSGCKFLDAKSKNGYALRLSYRGAEAEKSGSWGLKANYYNQGRNTYLVHTIDGNTEFENGFKGWSVGAECAVAKNLVAEVTYYDTRDKQDSNQKDHRIWSALTWKF